jgi:hypothetical protein
MCMESCAFGDGLQYDHVLSDRAPHAIVCSTHWGNMHGLLGHSRVTLHTVMHVFLSIVAAFCL